MADPYGSYGAGGDREAWDAAARRWVDRTSPWPPRPASIPGSVVSAAVIAMLLSVLVGCGAVIGLLALLAEYASQWEEEHTGGVFVLTALVGLSVAALVAASRVMRRSQGARVTLLVLAMLTLTSEVLLSIAMAVDGAESTGMLILTVPLLLGTATTVWLLSVRSAREWFATRPIPGAAILPYASSPQSGPTAPPASAPPDPAASAAPLAPPPAAPPASARPAPTAAEETPVPSTALEAQLADPLWSPPPSPQHPPPVRPAGPWPVHAGPVPFSGAAVGPPMPGRLLAAAIIAITFAAGTPLVLLPVLADPHSAADLRALWESWDVAGALLVLGSVLCLVATVAAAATLLRQRWAWWVLVGTTVAALLMEIGIAIGWITTLVQTDTATPVVDARIVAALALAGTVIWAAATVTSLAMLLAPSVRAWILTRPARLVP